MEIKSERLSTLTYFFFPSSAPTTWSSFEVLKSSMDLFLRIACLAKAWLLCANHLCVAHASSSRTLLPIYTQPLMLRTLSVVAVKCQNYQFRNHMEQNKREAQAMATVKCKLTWYDTEVKATGLTLPADNLRWRSPPAKGQSVKFGRVVWCVQHSAIFREDIDLGPILGLPRKQPNNNVDLVTLKTTWNSVVLGYPISWVYPPPEGSLGGQGLWNFLLTWR